MGEILDMTLEDELQGHPDDIETADYASMDEVLDAELDNIAENELLCRQTRKMSRV